MLAEGSELPKEEISPAAKELAEALHHEARTERIFTIIELALRAERSWMLESIRSSVLGYPDAGGDGVIMEHIEKLLDSKPGAGNSKYSIDHWKDETPINAS